MVTTRVFRIMLRSRNTEIHWKKSYHWICVNILSMIALYMASCFFMATYGHRHLNSMTSEMIAILKDSADRFLATCFPWSRELVVLVDVTSEQDITWRSVTKQHGPSIKTHRVINECFLVSSKKEYILSLYILLFSGMFFISVDIIPQLRSYNELSYLDKFLSVEVSEMTLRLWTKCPRRLLNTQPSSTL